MQDCAGFLIVDGLHKLGQMLPETDPILAGVGADCARLCMVLDFVTMHERVEVEKHIFSRNEPNLQWDGETPLDLPLMGQYTEVGTGCL